MDWKCVELKCYKNLQVIKFHLRVKTQAKHLDVSTLSQLLIWLLEISSKLKKKREVEKGYLRLKHTIRNHYNQAINARTHVTNMLPPFFTRAEQKARRKYNSPHRQTPKKCGCMSILAWFLSAFTARGMAIYTALKTVNELSVIRRTCGRGKGKEAPMHF